MDSVMSSRRKAGGLALNSIKMRPGAIKDLGQTQQQHPNGYDKALDFDLEQKPYDTVKEKLGRRIFVSVNFERKVRLFLLCIAIGLAFRYLVATGGQGKFVFSVEDGTMKIDIEGGFGHRQESFQNEQPAARHEAVVVADAPTAAVSRFLKAELNENARVMEAKYRNSTDKPVRTEVNEVQASVNSETPNIRTTLSLPANGATPFNASIALLYDHLQVVQRGADPSLYHEMKRPIPASLLSRYTVMDDPGPMKLEEICFDQQRALVDNTQRKSVDKLVHSDGTLIFAHELEMDELRTHFVFFIANLINAVRQARTRSDLYPRPTILMVPSLNISNGRYHKTTPLLERKLFGYIASQVDQVVALDQLPMTSNALTCFPNTHMTPRKNWSVLRAQDFTWLRESVNQFVKKPLNEHCSQLGLKKPVVWVLNRRVFSRKLLHIDMMSATIRQVFHEGGLDVDVIEFESPNTPCDAKCHGRIQCYQDSPFVHNDVAYPFYTNFVPQSDLVHESSFGGRCYAQDLDFDIAVFNNISFLIAVHGGALMNAMFLPDKAVLVEVHPYGVGDNSYAPFYNQSGLNHIMYFEESDAFVVEKFGKKMPVAELWKSENKGIVKALPVEISLDKFRPALEQARDAWKQYCYTS